MAFKMKPFSGFGNSPAKLIKKPTGPRAKVKKKTIDFENPKDRDKVYNKTEIKRP